MGSSRWKNCLLFRDGLTSEGHVAVEEASLEDEAQYAGTAHPLLLPSCHTAQSQWHHLAFNQTILEADNDTGVLWFDKNSPSRDTCFTPNE